MEHTLHSTEVTTVAGGYVLVREGDILRAWEALRKRDLSLADLRCWLACHELVARRQGTQNRARARYTVEELARTAGLASQSRAQRSVARLEHAGLLRWHEQSVDLPTTARGRLVPFPRRLLRYLAAQAPGAVVATAIGHLLRCVYFRRGRCSCEGLCKASWVALTFGVSERSVKRARAVLAALGWLVAVPTPQWLLNRHGVRCRVKLDWTPQAHCPSVSPQSLSHGGPLAPPESHKHPLRASKHQNPAMPKVADACAPVPLRPPTLRDVLVEDLRCGTRLQRLYELACDEGLAPRSEAGRLAFAGLAARALRLGRSNPPGLFAWLLRRGLWSHVAAADEDHARRMEHRTSARPYPSPHAAAPTPIAGLVGAWLSSSEASHMPSGASA